MSGSTCRPAGWSARRACSRTRSPCWRPPCASGSPAPRRATARSRSWTPPAEVRARRRLAGDRLTWHFVADSVADFAWATSNEFVWDATRATIPGRGVIPIDILYLPEHAAYRQTGAFARHALEFYSKLWMPYAFPQFTQVDGPEGGMEYPMLTMSGAGSA